MALKEVVSGGNGAIRSAEKKNDRTPLKHPCVTRKRACIYSNAHSKNIEKTVILRGAYCKMTKQICTRIEHLSPPLHAIVARVEIGPSKRKPNDDADARSQRKSTGDIAHWGGDIVTTNKLGAKKKNMKRKISGKSTKNVKKRRRTLLGYQCQRVFAVSEAAFSRNTQKWCVISV